MSGGGGVGWKTDLCGYTVYGPDDVGSEVDGAFQDVEVESSREDGAF